MDIIGRQTVISLLDERLHLSPDQYFIVHEAEDGEITHITYKEMNAFAEKVAGGLAELGVTKDSKVCVHLFNRIEFVASWIAILSLRASMVPSNVWNTAREMNYVVQKADVEFVITEQQFVPLFEEVLKDNPQLKAVIVVNSNESSSAFVPFSNILDKPRDLHASGCQTDDVAQLLFTSGTTSNPKAVMLTQGNLVWCALEGARHYYYSPEDRNQTSMPLFHVNGQSTVLSSLSVGATVILLEKYSASKFMEQARRHRSTTIAVVPMNLRTLLAQPESPQDKNHHIRFVKYAINVNDMEKDAFMKRFNLNLMNGYGMSETMVTISGGMLYGDRKWPAVGRPLFGREVFIVDDHRRPLPDGKTGEIALQGKPGRNLFIGYYKDPESTAAALRGDLFLTGDLGYFDEQGHLYYVGRKKEAIKRAGENVSPSEVETVLMGHPDVQEVAVIGVPDTLRDEALKAFVVKTEGKHVTEDDLIAYCQDRMAKFKIPSYFEFVDSLPKTSIGKIEKKRLYQMEQQKRANINS